MCKHHRKSILLCENRSATKQSEDAETRRPTNGYLSYPVPKVQLDRAAVSSKRIYPRLDLFPLLRAQWFGSLNKINRLERGDREGRDGTKCLEMANR